LMAESNNKYCMPEGESRRGYQDDIGESTQNTQEMIKKYLETNPELFQSFELPPEVMDLLIPPSLKEKVGNDLSVLKTGRMEYLIVNKGNKYSAKKVDDDFSFFESREAIRGDQEKRQLPFEPLIYAQFSNLNDRRDVLVIATMDVNKSLRNKGVGSDFQERLNELAGSFGFKSMVATATNEDALNFWRNNGFVKARGEVLAAMKKQRLVAKGDGLIPIIKNVEESK
jgi:hypothetical protein